LQAKTVAGVQIAAAMASSSRIIGLVLSAFTVVAGDAIAHPLSEGYGANRLDRERLTMACKHCAETRKRSRIDGGDLKNFPRQGDFFLILRQNILRESQVDLTRISEHYELEL